ncbi:MAG TPA: hypothetical protein DFS52_10465 [Myxococcales bacterium]|jgi:hypothetical protein|nr:hypothetical protein [Myxococcales bacterium]
MKRSIRIQLLALLTGLLASSASAAEATWLTAEKLQERFAKIASFNAEAEQTKQARFLARPLKSEVHMAFDSERITWKTVKPIASTLKIDRDGLHVVGSQAMAGAKQDPRAIAFVRFIRSVFALDFAQLEQDFVIGFEGGTMKAVPKDGSQLKGMIHAIEMTFTRELALEAVEVKTPDETSRLVFKSFEVAEKPAGVAPKAP